MISLFPYLWLEPEPYKARQVAPKIPPGKNCGVGVSTVFASDIQEYETALLDANGAYPVERYKTKAKAKEGHKKWAVQARSAKWIICIGSEVLGSRDKKIRLKRVLSKNKKRES